MCCPICHLYSFECSHCCLGLLAYIVEKFRAWSDCDGNLENRFTKDQILTDISIYWFNSNITSSFRMYYESMGPYNQDRATVSKYVQVTSLSLCTALAHAYGAGTESTCSCTVIMCLCSLTLSMLQFCLHASAVLPASLMCPASGQLSQCKIDALLSHEVCIKMECSRRAHALSL